MEQNDSKQTVNCTNCNAEFPKGTRFCTDCGKPIEQVPATDKTASGEKSTKESSISEDNSDCSECNAKVQHGSKFCTECGAKIEAEAKIKRPASPDMETRCPECNVEMSPGTRFCTECGTALQSKKSPASADTGQEFKKPRETSKRKIQVDETIDSVFKSGKGLMNGLGGFLNKTADGLDENLKQVTKSSKDSKSNHKSIKPSLKKETNTGYLVCDECSGYYQLQPEEAAANFDDKCECGGRLKYHKSLP